MIEAFQGFEPALGRDVYVAPSASVLGEVSLGDSSSVWHGAVVRGDCGRISIGAFSNIQDGCVCHTTTGGPELKVGDYVTVGHRAVLHSCEVGDGSLIGMGAIILDGARIGSGCIIAAGSVVLEGVVVPSGSLVAGIPATVRKALDAETAGRLRKQAIEYHDLALSFLGRGEFSRRAK